MKIGYYLNFILILILVVGCKAQTSSTDTTTTSTNTGDPDAVFFDVVYKTIASRLIGSTSWINVEGIQRYKFDKIDPTVTSSGSFIVAYSSYKEPQLYNNNYCTGTVNGTFSVVQTDSTSTSSTNTIYDPSTTYVPDQTSTDTSSQNFYSFNFAMTVASKSLSSGCGTTINPLASYKLNMIRFYNGDMIISYPDRGIEFYTIPELK